MLVLPDDLKNLPETVTLVAVSKTQPSEKIDQALISGLRHFGENRVQEAQKHWQEKRSHYPDLMLHLIGPLQTNKVREAVSLFDVIHTIDREKIARALKKEMDAQNKNIPCFIQVNIGNEPQKAGIAPDQTTAFYHLCQEIGLQIIGLMCIPPVDQDPVPHFHLLQEIGTSLGLQEFSMGMSDDYREAINNGATYIRVGSALFGERN